VRLFSTRLSAALSAKRRSRFAGVVVMLLGLVVTGGTYAVLAPAQAHDEEYPQELVERGRQLFLVGCASCHGKNGEGVMTQGGTQYGPPLVGVGAAAVDFQVGTGRMPLARPGVQAPRKDVLYTDEEIRALAAYVASLGPGPSIPHPEDYDPSPILTGEEEGRTEAVVQGGEFFRTNCTACHNFAGSGGALPQGRYAPSLDGVTPKHIYEAMLTGPQQMPVFSDDVLTPEQKRNIIAYLKSFEETPNYGGATLGQYGPVSEGFFAWTVGIGGCVAFAVWMASHTTRSSKKKGTKA
jgi:ubiquinol-cytochrome c reductase cytochrome c subunit